MIRKPRKPTFELLALDATEPRFPEAHPKYKNFKRDLGITQSGFNGEKSVDYYLENISNSPTSYLYHNLRLPASQTAFQMDTLLVTPYYLMIIEIKNWGGASLEFNEETKQVRQIYHDGRKEVHDDPVLQVKTQRKKLLVMLKKYGLSYIPVEYGVVMSNKNPEIIFSEGYKETDRVFRSTYLDYFLVEMDKKYTEKKLCIEKLTQLDQIFLNSHQERPFNVLEKYDLEKNQLLKGILCTECITPTSMYRAQRSWKCPKCHFRSN
ncbi:NERD domain-containing protein [Alteribacter keqinensis]|uniref:NERD domain-containing protein n=1 Tax=Alteribacter keqinensis TaxID=2483800 RepID=UPI001606CC16|nr:NERD domain-containing protein [Alteribacter keqinensis]